jgi:competence protein ComEC
MGSPSAGQPVAGTPSAARASEPPPPSAAGPVPGTPAAGLRSLARRPWQVAAGCLALGLALAPAGLSAALVVGLVLAAIGRWMLRAPLLAGLALALVAGGAMVGEMRLAALEAPQAGMEDGRLVAVRAHLLSRPRPSAFGSTAEVQVSGGRMDGARLLARFPQWSDVPRADIGQELAMSGRLRSLTGAEPQEGASDHAGYLRARGIAGELLVDRVVVTRRRRAGVAGMLDRMRERAGRSVDAGMPQEQAALARGMVLGQDETIPEAVRQDFRDSGLAHLLAVSGQNVMLLAALALPLLAVAGLGPRGRGAVLLTLIAIYVPLAGAGASLQRAGVMGAAGVTAMALSRPASRWYALLLAAAVTLALNPRACSDPGWQLSFAAVAGILVFGPPLRRAFRWLGSALVGSAPRGSATVGSGAGRLGARPHALAHRLGEGLAEGAALTVAATIATAPLLAHHFDAVPLAGLPANLVALPAVAPAMWLGMCKAALGQLATVLPQAETAANALGPPTALFVRYLGGTAARFADLPGGSIELPLGRLPAVIAAYAALGLARLATRSGMARLRPRAEQLAAFWRRRPRAERHAVGVAVAALLFLLGLKISGGPAPPDDLTVRFLDVGQGDATLIQPPDGAAVLFDGGPPEAAVTRLLRRAGVRRLALVVATHPSRDHHGGLAQVLARFPVGLLLDGGDGTRDAGFRSVLSEAARQGVRRVPAIAPMSLKVGEIMITILSPAPRPPGPPPEDPNPRAVVALVQVGEFDLLLSADAESEALLPLNLPDVEAMKVPHHGSADPGLARVLERLRPELAAIEVGPNTYGHPTPSTLAALRHAGVATYRTDRRGTVSVTVTEEGMEVSTER